MKRRHHTPEPEFAFVADCFSLGRESVQPVAASAPVILAEMSPEERARIREQSRANAPEVLTPRAGLTEIEREIRKVCPGYREGKPIPSEIARSMPGLAAGSQWGD